MRKTLTLILSLIFILSAVTNSYAAFTDVPSDASYLNALERLSVLGIMGGTDKGTFNPDGMLTREQFAKVIVVASGLESDAAALRGSTVFADIPLNAWSSGYINEALNKGFITGMPDGKFHPGEKVTFAQACTVLVRALGYTDDDLKGYWPNNYIEKARSLKLTEGITLNKNEGLPRWAAAVMINSLLSTNIKSTASAGGDKTFSEASQLYSSYIYMGDSSTLDNLSDNQIMTDKGIFYIDSNIKKGLEMGNKYEFYVENDKVIKVFNKLKSLFNVTVESALDNRILYKDTAGKASNMTLPDKTVYYYNGSKQSYENIKNILQSNTSIIFAYNESKDGYDYSVILDPIYSKPQSGYNLDISKRKVGNITIEEGIRIFRNGEQSSLSDIEEKDAIYKVTDIWGKNGYLLVSGNTVEGNFKAFLQSITSPKQIKIGTTTYDISKDMDLGMLAGSSAGFKEDDYVVAVLGNDGNVVNVLYPESDGTNYAFVLNYSMAGSDSGTLMYSVKLLFPNNQTATRRVDFDPSKYKGMLITYKELDDDKIYIYEVGYTYNTRYTVNKLDGKIDSNYVTDNIKIFNLVTNDEGSDAQVNILNWSDLPDGTYKAGSMLYCNTTGDFNDVNIAVTSDILDQKNRLGVLVKTSATSSTILVGGKEYTYPVSFDGLPIGSVYEYSMKSNGIESLINSNISPAATSSTIDAVDTKRIKIGSNIYRFRSDVSIYLKDFKGDISTISVKDLDISKTFSKVSVYIDDKGMVRLVTVSEI